MTPPHNDPIRIRLASGLEFQVAVEEHQPVDPAAYQWEAGWSCFDLDGTEYFVSETGVVYKQPSNEVVGIAPVVKAQADRTEAEMMKFALLATEGIGPCDCDGCLAGGPCEIDRLSDSREES